MNTLQAQFLLFVCGALLPGLAAAQSLGDPTRPAIVDLAPETDAASSKPAIAGGLQTILRRKGARPAAIINGQYVELGGKVGDARLLQVNESEVVLQGPNGREELRLTPAVEKSQSISPSLSNHPLTLRGSLKK